ncbi:hypothetical protein CCO03_07880 [Comamonas serinivorans]|uniref:Uncharacterized protein n=1 Tax=Comamonas serinivorans TaxID=1082851 RepID=A0A1Y0EMA9_9BURK|nr:hypothetical protein CCO03_07880 [Comamonas serinivorans]
MRRLETTLSEASTWRSSSAPVRVDAAQPQDQAVEPQDVGRRDFLGKTTMRQVRMLAHQPGKLTLSRHAHRPV